LIAVSLAKMELDRGNWKSMISSLRSDGGKNCWLISWSAKSEATKTPAVTAMVIQRPRIAMFRARAKSFRKRPGASVTPAAGGFSRAPATTGVNTTATSHDAISAIATT
jgi:hypothetical protein